MKKKSLLLAIVMTACLIFASACAITPQISTDKLSLVENQTHQLTTNFDVSNWQTSNKAVVTVENGLVTALSAGYAIITATGKNQSCICEVAVKTDRVTLSNKTLRICVGTTFALTATNVSQTPIAFTTDNPDVATVDEKGLVAAISVGNAQIKAISGKQTALCTVTVLSTVRSFKTQMDSANLTVGQSSQITATLSVFDQQENNYVDIQSGFVFASDNPSVVTVDDKGLVTAIGSGKTTVQISHPQYEVQKQLEIVVVEQIDNLDLTNPKHLNVYGRVQKVTYNGKSALKLVNTASGFELTFKGTELKADIASTGSWAYHFLKVYVDGVESKVKITKNFGYSQVTLASNLDDGIHTLVAYKVHEEEQNTMYLAGFSGATSYYTPPQRPSLKIEFYGDSITAGWSALTATDMGNSADTSDGTVTYAFVAGQKLNAEVEYVCMSGISLTVPMWNTANFMKNCYKQYSVKDTTQWAFDNPADVVVINLGTNDGEGIANNRGTLKDFADAYKTLLTNLRLSHPNAHIICVYGMMHHSNTVAPEILSVVQSLNQTDSKIYTLQLGDASMGHPGKATHYACGETLANFIAELQIEN